MLNPAKDCPQIAVVSRWGWSSEANTYREARKAAKKLGLVSCVFDKTIKVKDPGSRLPVTDRVICVYSDELDACKAATENIDLQGFRFLTRERKTFGEEFEFMEREMIENPGYILIADCGLNQFLDMADVPGQETLSVNAVTAKLAFSLRIAKEKKIRLMCVRHQLNTGASVKGLPPQPQSAETGYVRLNPPTANMQQLFIISAEAKAHWRPWNFLEDRARAEDERKLSGKNAIALIESMCVRFGEDTLVRDRYAGSEWTRNATTLTKEYGIKFRKEFPKHHG